jgi:hypothetical protein
MGDMLGIYDHLGIFVGLPYGAISLGERLLVD